MCCLRAPGCVFEGCLRAPGCVFEGCLRAPGCVVEGCLRAPGCVFEGCLRAPGCVVEGCLRAPGCVVERCKGAPLQLFNIRTSGLMDEPLRRYPNCWNNEVLIWLQNQPRHKWTTSMLQEVVGDNTSNKSNNMVI